MGFIYTQNSDGEKLTQFGAVFIILGYVRLHIETSSMPRGFSRKRSQSMKNLAEEISVKIYLVDN